MPGTERDPKEYDRVDNASSPYLYHPSLRSHGQDVVAEDLTYDDMH